MKQNKTKILFVGTFLSSKKGTKPIAEKLEEKLSNQFNISITSKQKNKFLRILDICFSVLFKKGKCIIVDVFSGQAFYIGFIATLTVKLFTRKKVILILRGGKLKEFYFIKKNLIHKLFNLADKIITPSVFLQQFFKAEGYDITYLKNFVELDIFDYNRSNYNKLSLLWVRSFIKTYNPEIPIQILSALRKKNIPVTLTMIGPDDGLRGECEKLANDLIVTEFVTFTGSVRNDELPKYYQSHGIYLNTTSYESFGNAVMEAAACGIPVISNNVGELPYIWEDRKSIVLVKDNNLEEYLDAITELLNNDELYNNISLNARVNSQNYSWQVVRKEWIDLLNDI